MLRVVGYVHIRSRGPYYMTCKRSVYEHGYILFCLFMKLSCLIKNSHRHGNASYVLNIQHNVLHAFSKKLLKHIKYLDNFNSCLI